MNIHRWIRKVKGFSDKANDLFLCSSSSSPSAITVFFPGDIQDDQLHTPLRFNRYSIENTARAIALNRPHHLVLCVKPSLKRGLLSVYKNFISVAPPASASYQSVPIAISQLNALLQRIQFPVESMPIHLVGFSRGGIVLNQMIWEATAVEESFWGRVESIMWIDSGNGGMQGAYPNKPEVIDRFCRLLKQFGRDCRMEIVGTPYQFGSQDRFWIAKEAREFANRLQQMECSCSIRMIYSSQTSSMEQHMESLFCIFPLE